ncbi:MAG: YggU family protein [Candidatus Omnitrophica bacterium]|nr:YggU family protein [Candidatus Omnitrophota bacterium]
MNIQVTVKTKAKVQKLIELEENQYSAHVKSPAIEGKANQELVRLLAEKFGVPKSRVEIVRGEKSRLKLVEIQNEF